MTTAARLVLADCEQALQELKECDIDLEKEIGSMRRRRWMAVVALLRAVGHVLRNVDRESSPTLAKIIDAEWNAVKETRPDPTILWGFIENERNTVLKEYKFRSKRKAYATAVSSLTVSTETGNVVVKPNKFGDAEVRILTEAPFTGRHDIAVVIEAVEWWKAFLDKIDAQSAG